MRSFALLSALVSTVALAAACTQSQESSGAGTGGKADELGDLPGSTPTRIILMIGDGMGAAHITGGAYLADEPLAMLSMEEMGFVSTHEHEFVTTDSAASASAMASGSKTHFGGIGVLPGTDKDHEEDAAHHLDTVVNEAMRNDWKTGLVVTTSVVDATPASFGAHRAQRSSKEAIALDLASSGIDVLIGGGTRYFEDRADGANLLNQMRNDGYSVARTRTGLRRVDGTADKVIALLAEKDMPEVNSGERAMSLADMTDSALQVLDKDNDEGFFLMVEGSWIDRESHSLNAPSSLAEVVDFDEAVAVALDYARGRDDTLVVVTADHETGGLTILDPNAADPYVDALGGEQSAASMAAFPNSFSTAPLQEAGAGEGLAPEIPFLAASYGHLSVASRPSFFGPGFVYKATHSATMVPLFAEGPAAEWLSSVRDNADLGDALKRLVLADGGGGNAAPAPAAEEAPDSVILVVGDGAGLSAMSAGHYALGERTGVKMPVSGLLATHARDALVAPSTASATSLTTGELAESDAQGAAATLSTLLEEAEGAGLKTALVTTASIADPTLAALSVRADSAELAPLAMARLGEGQGSDGVDLLIAGGRESVNSELMDTWTQRGVDVELELSPIALGQQGVRLVADGALAPAAERAAGGSEPTLAEMSATALSALEQQSDDFFLMVYADGVRRRAEEQERGAALLDEVSELNQTLELALQTAARRGNTAVVYLSLSDSTLSIIDNHYGFHKGQCGAALRCGGSELLIDLPIALDEVHRGEGFADVGIQGDFSDLSMILQYAWTHQAAGPVVGASSASATFTPLFAAGQGSKSLEGFRTLAEAGAVIRGWLRN